MSADTVTPPPATQPAPPRSRRKRWLKRLLPPFTLLLLALWFAPTIVAKTELRNRFARQALADVRGSVEVGGASLGWFAPVELRDVVIKDETGRTIVSAPKITSQKSLVALARGRAEPGEFTVENPTVTVACSKNSTSIEGAFAEYLKESAAPAPTRTPVTVKVTGGTLVILDTETEQGASLEGISATVSVPASRAEPVTASLTAATGGLSAEASVGAGGSAKIVCAGIALDTFAPLLKRVDPGLSLTGAVSTDLRVTWGTDATGRPTLGAAGTVSGKHLAVSAPWLNGDRLAFDSVELPLDVERTGRGFVVRKFELTSDVGTVFVAGTLDPEEPTETLLTQPGAAVGANIDVAKLAAKLPKLLRVKNGTEFHEGKLVVRLVSRADAKGTVWEGKIDTSALKGTVPKKFALFWGIEFVWRDPIAWDQPLHVKFLGRYTKGQLPTFDELICTSDFVAVNAKVTPETVQLSANVLLDKLGERLADFVDLGGFTLDGKAFASLAGERDRDGKFNAEVIVKLDNFAVLDHNQRGLKEPALALQINATGTLPENGPVRLATATATLAANGDELRLALLEPVANVRELSSGSVDVRIVGELARWNSRVAAFVPLPELPLSGSIDARGKVKLATDRVTVERLTVALVKPKLDRWVALDEPAMSAVGDLVFTRANRVATITNLTITSETLKVANGTLAFELPANGEVVVSGNGRCDANLNRLGKTVKLYDDPNGPDALSGRGVGPVRFRTNGDTTTFGGTLDVTDFGYGPKDKLDWFEPTLRVEIDGSYAADAVAFAAAKVDRTGLMINAKGTLSKISATRDVNFTGTLRYDWAKLAPLVQKFAGASFTATGTGSRGFALSGQLDPTASALPPEPKTGRTALKAPTGPPVARPKPNLFVALGGEAAFGWHSLSAYGFDIGTVELSAKMTRGVVKVERVYTTLAGGKATLEPTLDLSTDPGSVTVTKGAVIDRAKITTGSLAEGGALRFALPAFSGALQADGEFSAAIEDNRVSMGDINQTTAKGVLLIHRATVGLTPVAAQVANLLGAKDTTMTLANETAVTVQVANGRVHHQNFAIRIAGTTFRTSGSVGFDQSLKLVVEVPLPKDLPLLKNNAVLMKAVAGKVVKVPLEGTLAKPTLDAEEFNKAVIALAREGAKDVGKELLESELRKLFPGTPAPGTTPKPGGGLIPFPFGKKP